MHDPHLRPARDGVPLRRVRSHDARSTRLGADSTHPSEAGSRPASVPEVRSEEEVNMADGPINTTDEARRVFAAQELARRSERGREMVAKFQRDRAEQLRLDVERRMRVEADRRTAEERTAERKRQSQERIAALEAVRSEKSKQRAAAKKRRLELDRKLRAEAAAKRETERLRKRSIEEARMREAERLATERTERAARNTPEAIERRRIEAIQRRRDAQEEKRENDRAEDHREMLLALYDHPATARLLRLVNAGRWDPEVNLPAWLDAAEMIPEDLRQFALSVRREFDPLHSIGRKIAALGGDTLHTIGRLYGLSRERIRQIKEDGLRHLRIVPEVRAMRDSLETEPDAPSFRMRERGAA